VGRRARRQARVTAPDSDYADAEGNVLTDAEWTASRDEFLPSAADRDFIESLMQPQTEPGKFAGWIAPPKVGIDNKPGEFEYVKIVDA